MDDNNLGVINGMRVTHDEWVRYAINVIAHETNPDRWYDYHFDLVGDY